MKWWAKWTFQSWGEWTQSRGNPSLPNDPGSIVRLACNDNTSLNTLPWSRHYWSEGTCYMCASAEDRRSVTAPGQLQVSIEGSAVSPECTHAWLFAEHRLRQVCHDTVIIYNKLSLLHNTIMCLWPLQRKVWRGASLSNWKFVYHISCLNSPTSPQELFCQGAC